MSGATAERWRRLWWDATHAPPPEGLYETWVTRYSEPHRHYHNVRHIAECLDEFDSARHFRLMNIEDPLLGVGRVQLVGWLDRGLRR